MIRHEDRCTKAERNVIRSAAIIIVLTIAIVIIEITNNNDNNKLYLCKVANITCMPYSKESRWQTISHHKQ